jgi:hypothetical protein
MVKYPVVNIAELRCIVSDLLDHVESVHGPELRLDQDYFWDLGSEAMYDVTRKVSSVDLIGSLGDSWEFLLNMRRDDLKQDGPSLMLVHAAPLLRYIGEKVGK